MPTPTPTPRARRNLYRSILQRLYGLTVRDLQLVVLHPDHDDYMVAEVPLLDDEIEAVLAYRLAQLELEGKVPQAAREDGPLPKLDPALVQRFGEPRERVFKLEDGGGTR